MASKSPFNEAEVARLLAAARRIQKRFKNQREMAEALGITQPSLSALLRGQYKPGVSLAHAIADLEPTTLEQLVGVDWTGRFGAQRAARQRAANREGDNRYPNLSVCLAFHGGTRAWSPWTLAAARAGVLGETDYAPPEWAERLDLIERALAVIRCA